MSICFLIFVLFIVSLVSTRGKFKRQISLTYYVSSRSRSSMNEHCLFFVETGRKKAKRSDWHILIRRSAVQIVVKLYATPSSSQH